jgi:hypothetical protein
VTTIYHASTLGKGSLTLKTYDPVSGAVIKFRTSKIADVGRLVAGLHRLAREQTGAPVPVETGTHPHFQGQKCLDPSLVSGADG